eukprot:TRINITY_DN32445_c0_g1_i1.p1 TRINITY_DN32445_c0_g1~~TRINITY_DN32445_c0_g1_i1.p1  ORF type:complete len:212 (+),score=9.60 TRINITY_DN32445_c0_g1_i1:61-636(+)
MARGFVLTVIASSTLCQFCSLRTAELVVGKRRDDTRQFAIDSRSFIRELSFVGRFLQQGVAVHASSLLNTTRRMPQHEIEVSDDCMKAVLSASDYCQSESVWFYKCMPPMTVEDKERSFPLDEACLADLRKDSKLNTATTGCCSDLPDYSHGCCKPTTAGNIILYSMYLLPLLCVCCCTCFINIMRLRHRS